MGIEKIMGILVVILMTIGGAVYYNFGRVESMDSTLKSHISESDKDRSEIKKRLFDHVIGH